MKTNLLQWQRPYDRVSDLGQSVVAALCTERSFVLSPRQTTLFVVLSVVHCSSVWPLSKYTHTQTREGVDGRVSLFICSCKIILHYTRYSPVTFFTIFLSFRKFFVGNHLHQLFTILLRFLQQFTLNASYPL